MLMKKAPLELAPFNAACVYNCIESVRFVMRDSRVDVNKEDNYGRTPTFNAFKN
jgi:hypothetical protein